VGGGPKQRRHDPPARSSDRATDMQRAPVADKQASKVAGYAGVGGSGMLKQPSLEDTNNEGEN